MNNSSYTLEYLPLARNDMTDIVRYVSHNLSNPSAATRLAEKLVGSADKMLAFPYSNPVYIPIKPLGKEYRRIFVDNYIMFYWIDESKKTVTASRVLYCRRDYENLLME